MNILQVNTSDIAGGAEKVAMSLLHLYRDMGHESFLAVGSAISSDPSIIPLPIDENRSWWEKLCISLAGMNILKKPNRMLCRLLRTWILRLGQPQRYIDFLLGHEDYHYAGSKKLLQLTPKTPDILHCHNLHGGYFDLRTLPELGRKVPLVLTLHDAWLLSGHCAHSFACERWKTGCGLCPDLTIYPEIKRDGTAYNFNRKKKIFSQCQFHIATPSKWLMEKVRQSILNPSIIESRIIPNGVPIDIFKPGNRFETRTLLGIDQDDYVLLFSANGIRNNPWKDFSTMREAVIRLSSRKLDKKILFIALGESSPPEKFGDTFIRFIPFQKSPEDIAKYYQAADLYVHAAREETFGISLVEALACGTPVVATSVGGIPEIVRSLNSITHSDRSASYPRESATGLLLRGGEPDTLAQGIESLLTNKDIREQLSINASVDAKERFDLRKQAQAYVAWFVDILAEKGHQGRSG